MSFYILLLKPLRCGARSSKITCAWSVLSFPKCCTCSSFQQSYLKSDPEVVCVAEPVCPSPSCKRTMLPHSLAERLCNVLSKTIYLLHAAPLLHYDCTVGVVFPELHVPDDNYVAIIPFFPLCVRWNQTDYCIPSYCSFLIIQQGIQFHSLSRLNFFYRNKRTLRC